MSGPQLALVVAVGVLALVALAGVAALLAQVRTLRRELAETFSQQRAPAGDAAPPPAVVQPAVSPGPVSVPTNQQIVLATLGHPLVRVVALSHGLRQALRAENRDRIGAVVRRDLQRRQKLRRRAGRRAARALPSNVPVADQRRRDLAS
ncbi:MAG: hypothetical protein M3474_02390 [Actinomycetota bacterium]|nr:hypothetical protein [Actinomycetota bacterium]